MAHGSRCDSALLEPMCASSAVQLCLRLTTPAADFAQQAWRPAPAPDSAPGIGPYGAGQWPGVLVRLVCTNPARVSLERVAMMGWFTWMCVPEGPATAHEVVALGSGSQITGRAA